MNRLLSGLPSLTGVLAGIFIYTSNTWWPWIAPFVVWALSGILLLIGKSLVLKFPKKGEWFFEPWILSAISIVSFTTAFIVWLSINAPTWFNVSKDEIDAVSGAFIGAITAYFAFVWTDDINDTKGRFYPSTQFKQVLLKFPITAETGTPKEVDAAFYDKVGGGPTGWGFLLDGNEHRFWNNT